MIKKLQRSYSKYRWHDGYCRSVFSHEIDCMIDMSKLMVRYGQPLLRLLFAAVDWEQSEAIPASFFEKGGKDITHADVIYRLHFKGTDRYFYLLLEHKDKLSSKTDAFAQLAGYATRIWSREAGCLVLPVLFVGGSGDCRADSYVDAACKAFEDTPHIEKLLATLKSAFFDCTPLKVVLQHIPDKVLLKEGFLSCPAFFYALKHHEQLNRKRITTLLHLCREMDKRGKRLVTLSTLWYAIDASGLSHEEWRQIEIEDTALNCLRESH